MARFRPAIRTDPDRLASCAEKREFVTDREPQPWLRDFKRLARSALG